MIIFNNQSHKKNKNKNKKLKTQNTKLYPINQNRILKNTKLYQAKIEMQEK